MMDNTKTISIFGVTGSIGTSAVEVIKNNFKHFSIDTIVAKNNVNKLIELAILLKPKLVVIYNESKYQELIDGLKVHNIEVSSGKNAIIQASKRKVDIFIAAIMGYEGLFTTYNSIPYVKTIALANKESMVCAGNLIIKKAKKFGCKIIPIDSEHNTLFQLIDNEGLDDVKKVIITASGGPFVDLNKKDLRFITPKQAIKHPVWDMGAKISVDSATMMNKGLELIEAAYLFNICCSKIDVLVHRQSIIHALVEYTDGFVKAGMYNPDMKAPISHALSYPKKMDNKVQKLDLSKINKLTFEKPNEVIFNAIKICRQAFASGPLSLIILNASNEVAVDAFLSNKITFDKITAIIEEVLSKNFENFNEDIDNIVKYDEVARKITFEIIAKG